MRYVIAYAVAGLLTFGYSFNADYREAPGPFVQSVELNTVGALFAAVGWPLYWSVQAFRGLRPK
jgi:hypothetical protein